MPRHIPQAARTSLFQSANAEDRQVFAHVPDLPTLPFAEHAPEGPHPARDLAGKIDRNPPNRRALQIRGSATKVVAGVHCRFCRATCHRTLRGPASG